MTPSLDVVGNPLAWLKTLSQHQINICIAPNSAYASVLRAWKAIPPQKRPTLAKGGLSDGWDLSYCIQLLSVGGPIQGSVIREFFTVFKHGGLNSSSFKVSSVVSGPRDSLMNPVLLRFVRQPMAWLSTVSRGSRSRSVSRVPLKNPFTVHVITMSGISHGPLFTVQGKVSVGGPRWGVDVKIVDPTTKNALPEGQQGEVWVNSESKAEGYLLIDAEERERVFQAKINGQLDSPVSSA